MITYTHCTFKVKTEDYLKKLHEFYKACKSLGLLPHNSAIVSRESESFVVTGIEISKRHIYPRHEGYIEAGDTIELLVGQLNVEEVKL